MPKTKQKPQPSMSVARKQQEVQAMSRGAIPDDIGLIEGTFIMPRGKNRPSWLNNFWMRWKLEKHRAWQRLMEGVQ